VRYVDKVVNDNKMWPRLCLMTKDPYDHVDRYGCSESSYFNASYTFERYIRDNLNFTEDQMQRVVNKTFNYILNH